MNCRLFLLTVHFVFVLHDSQCSVSSRQTRKTILKIHRSLISIFSAVYSHVLRHEVLQMYSRVLKTTKWTAVAVIEIVQSPPNGMRCFALFFYNDLHPRVHYILWNGHQFCRSISLLNRSKSAQFLTSQTVKWWIVLEKLFQILCGFRIMYSTLAFIRVWLNVFPCKYRYGFPSIARHHRTFTSLLNIQKDLSKYKAWLRQF